MTELAIYDMDRTITRTGTFTPFLMHAALRVAPWRLAFAPLVPLVMLAYAAKLITRARLKEWNQRLLLGPHLSEAKRARVATSFAELVWRTNILPGALRQIEADRAAGRRLVMATASYRLYVEAIAEKLGFDDVIATNSVLGLDSRVLAKIDGENAYGPAKLRMIQAWLAEQGIDRRSVRVVFYSDHASDAPVMEWADEAVAANPSAKMRALATKRGWRIEHWGLQPPAPLSGA